MTGALESFPHSLKDRENFATYSRNFEGALEEHERFNRGARDVLTTTAVVRLRNRLSPFRR
jgi:hypothetical protein